MPRGADISTSLSSIPPFPKIATEVLRLLQDPNSSTPYIVGLVEKDVAITTAVLKLANSGLYGRRGTVASVRAAFRALGAEAFSQAVVRTSLKNYLRAGMPTADLNRCWAHSIACSEISKILATGLNLPPEIALSAGLLHDLGRFGLAFASPVKHNQLLSGGPYSDILIAEHALFGIDHTEVGSLLADQFGLPEEIRLAAARHHDKSLPDGPNLLAIVGTACSVATALGFHVLDASPSLSLDDVIAAAPAYLAPRVSPVADEWMTALLNVVQAA